MSSTFLALMLMQYVVSVKAGLVNHVQGTANVAEMEMASPGRPIRTAANGYVEVLLTPGSFLRIGENSAVVLDGVDLESVSLHLVQGPAVIEVIDIDKNHPIRVTTGKLTTDIVAAGIYKFSDGVATVLDGKLQTPTKLSYAKGWQVYFQDNYRARKVGKVQTRASTSSARLDPRKYPMPTSAWLHKSAVPLMGSIRIGCSLPTSAFTPLSLTATTALPTATITTESEAAVS